MKRIWRRNKIIQQTETEKQASGWRSEIGNKGYRQKLEKWPEWRRLEINQWEPTLKWKIPNSELLWNYPSCKPPTSFHLFSPMKHIWFCSCLPMGQPAIKHFHFEKFLTSMHAGTNTCVYHNIGRFVYTASHITNDMWVALCLTISSGGKNVSKNFHQHILCYKKINKRITLLLGSKT